jgi:hypothetical protein
LATKDSKLGAMQTAMSVPSAAESFGAAESFVVVRSRRRLVGAQMFGESPLDGGANLVAPGANGPANGAPGELGVTGFVLDDACERRAHEEIGRARERLGSEEGTERFADAALFEGANGERNEIHRRLERPRNVELSWAERASGIAACCGKAESRVLDFVERGALRIPHEIGRGAEREELEREAREGGNRSVLEERVVEPRACEAGANALG